MSVSEGHHLLCDVIALSNTGENNAATENQIRREMYCPLDKDRTTDREAVHQEHFILSSIRGYSVEITEFENEKLLHVVQTAVHRREGYQHVSTVWSTITLMYMWLFPSSDWVTPRLAWWDPEKYLTVLNPKVVSFGVYTKGDDYNEELWLLFLAFERDWLLPGRVLDPWECRRLSHVHTYKLRVHFSYLFHRCLLNFSVVR